MLTIQHSACRRLGPRIHRWWPAVVRQDSRFRDRALVTVRFRTTERPVSRTMPPSCAAFRSQFHVSDSPPSVSPVAPPPTLAATSPADAGLHREGTIRPWPWWAPRFWHGMPLGVWLSLAGEHRWRASPSRWGLVASITAASAFNSLAAQFSDAVYRRGLRSPPTTPPPLFIIGHWRSGTTLLHELLMHDERFCCPNYYQCFAPSHFLLTERVLTPAVSWIMPTKRPMDDMTVSLDKPQEDEFALLNLGAPSPYRRMAFPVTSSRHPEALDLATLPPAELDRWRRTLRRFLGMLAVADPRRPVLKSPPHTARVGVLAEMFPEAKFLHIVRDPFAVFGSTLRLWRSLDGGQGLQVDRGKGLEEYVFEAFEQMYAAFERDRATLAPGRLHDVRYEELVADPVGQIGQAYERLELGGFEGVRGPLEKKAETMKTYRASTYRHDPRIVAEISRRWRPFLDRYGYAAP